MIDFSSLTPATQLLIDDRLMPLGPGSPNLAVRGSLSQLSAATLFARPVQNLDFANACLAGLWLWHDFLDESHTISQSISTPEGSWWHGIMHRREPDAWNSKYWFRRVGHHPVVAQLVEHAPALGYKFTDSFEFVDFCDRLRGSGTPEETVAKQVQRLEWRLLFAHCSSLAIS